MAYKIDSNDKLICHFNKVDASTPKPITFAGTAQLDVDQFKFGTSSLLLDGNSDYITAPDSSDWFFSDGDLTIDCWVRMTSVAGSQPFLAQYVDATHYWEFGMDISGGQALYFLAKDGATTITVTSDYEADNFTADTWYHVAVCRKGDNWHLFINGSRLSFSTYTGNTEAVADLASTLRVGYNERTTQYFGGHIDEVRVLKGKAAWTGTFNAKSNIHISDQYTAILLHLDGADAATSTHDASGSDESGNNRASTYVVTAQLDTGQSKLGDSSLLLDGNSDYVTFPDSADWDFDSGDFTIDCWARFSSVAAGQILFGQYADATHYWRFGLDVSGANKAIFLQSNNGGTLMTITSVFASDRISADTWHHIAITRKSTTTWSIFIDGVKQTFAAQNNPSEDMQDLASTLRIGYSEEDSTYFGGNVDEVRVSKGVARWTSDFNPPAREYGYNIKQKVTVL